jgi:hypothetical protein
LHSLRQVYEALRGCLFSCEQTRKGILLQPSCIAVSEAGLRGLEGLFLVFVSRLGKVIHAVAPEFILQEGEKAQLLCIGLFLA